MTCSIKPEEIRVVLNSGGYARYTTGVCGGPWKFDFHDVTVHDVALGLRLGRFGNQTEPQYTVNEHSMLAADWWKLENPDGPAWLQLCVLWHDAPEGLGFGDVQFRVKRQFPEYRRIEHQAFDALMLQKFDITVTPEVHDQIERVDGPLGATEFAWMFKQGEVYRNRRLPLGLHFRFLSMEASAQMFAEYTNMLVARMKWEKSLEH